MLLTQFNIYSEVTPIRRHSLKIIIRHIFLQNVFQSILIGRYTTIFVQFFFVLDVLEVSSNLQSGAILLLSEPERHVRRVRTKVNFVDDVISGVSLAEAEQPTFVAGVIALTVTEDHALYVILVVVGVIQIADVIVVEALTPA